MMTMAFLTPTPIPGCHTPPQLHKRCHRRPPHHRQQRSSRLVPPSPQATQTPSKFPPEPPAPSTPDEVRDLMTSEDYVERLRGAARVKALPEPERLNALINLCNDSNSQVRYTAVSGLSGFESSSLSEEEGKRLLEVMRKLMYDDGESSVQAAAADVIAGLGLKEGFDDLVKLFGRTKDWMVKFSIVAGMGGMGEKAFWFLKELVVGEGEIDSLVLTGAIGALGDLGDPRGLELVEAYLESKDTSVKERAKISYDMLKGNAVKE